MREELVRLRDAGRVYGTGPGAVVALRPTTFRIMSGEFVCLAGPSGSGKTTLLNLAAGLDSPTTGEVFLLGQRISALSRRETALLRRDGVGIVFQSYNLLQILSAYENVEYPLLLRGLPAHRRRELTERALASVGMMGRSERRPCELSGGEQQRVAVARAIVAGPALVFADEPTANLDSGTGEGLIELFSLLNAEKGICFVFSTHDSRIIQRARRVAEMRDGTVVSDTGESGA